MDNRSKERDYDVIQIKYLWSKFQLFHLKKSNRLSVNYAIISSNNGLAPNRCQAITWTNAGFLSMRPLGTNFSKIPIKIQNISFKKMHSKMSSDKRQPFCFLLNVVSGPAYALWWFLNSYLRTRCVLSNTGLTRDTEMAWSPKSMCMILLQIQMQIL